MGFGQIPNTESTPFERENEPSVEEQEGISDLFGPKAQERVEGIRRNIDDFQNAQDGENERKGTEQMRPAELGGFETFRNRRKKTENTHNAYFEAIDRIDSENKPSGWEHPRNKKAEGAARAYDNVQGRLKNHTGGIAETDTQEVTETKKKTQEKALMILREKLELDGIEQVIEELKKPNGEQRIREALGDNFSKQWKDEFILRLLDEQTKEEVDTLRRLRLMEQTALEDTGLFDQMVEAEDMDEFIKKNGDKSKIFRDFIQEEERLQKLDEDYQQRKELEHAESALKEAAPRVLSAAAAALLAESGVSADVLNQLPPEGVAAVENVVNEGGAKVVGAMLSNGVSVNDRAFIGRIAGQYVSLDFGDQNLYLVGEHAADRANQSFYPIDPPTVAGFEKILIHSVGEQNRMPFIANHSEQAQAMWERVVGDPGDESFPQEENITRFRNFLILLIGEGNPDESGEGKRLEKLGILTKGTSTVNRSRVDLFIRALEKFVPSGLIMHEGDSTVSSGKESPSFNYEDALTLATMWDADNKRMPESIDELKDLTKRRQKGEDVTSRRFA